MLVLCAKSFSSRRSSSQATGSSSQRGLKASSNFTPSPWAAAKPGMEVGEASKQMVNGTYIKDYEQCLYLYNLSD